MDHEAESKERGRLLFDIRRSMRYHDRRRTFFERMHQVTGVLTILLAGSVLFDLAGNGGHALWLNLIGVIAAVFAAADIIVGYASMANKHALFRRRFSDLDIALVNKTKSLEECVNERKLIENDEGTVYRALDLLCYNEILIAEGFRRSDPDDAKHFVSLEWYESLTANLWPWSDIADIEEARRNKADTG